MEKEIRVRKFTHLAKEVVRGNNVGAKMVIHQSESFSTFFRLTFCKHFLIVGCLDLFFWLGGGWRRVEGGVAAKLVVVMPTLSLNDTLKTVLVSIPLISSCPGNWAVFSCYYFRVSELQPL